MRIGFNCRFLHAACLTGVERYATDLLTSLITVGPDEEFVLFGCGKAAGARFIRDNVNFAGSCTSKNAAIRQVWEQTALPALAARVKVDILVNPTNIAPLAFSRNLVVIHDLSFLEHPEWFARVFRLLYKFVVPKVAKKALAIITDSEYSRRKIVELLRVPEGRVHTVYPAPDTLFRRAEAEEIEGVRKKHGLNKPYILSVGSIAPRKNLIAALQAFCMAKPKLGDSVEMVVAGAGSFQFPNVELESKNTRDVKLLGYVTDEELRALYSGAELFLYPSLYEGFGLPPLEAMACGAPVVSSNTTSLPEAVGSAALLVDPHDAQGIADAIVRVMSDGSLADDLRRRGLQHVQQFSWEETARQTLNVYREVLAAD